MKTLLQRARAGDADAFAILFQQHAPNLWRTAWAVLQNEQSAADALQETTIKAWQALPSFSGKSSLATWLTRILLNTCFDEQRREHKVIPFADIAKTESDAGPAATQPIHIQPLPGVEDAIQRLDADAVLDQLSEEDRAILALCYGEDLPLREAAAVLGITEGAVRTRLFRARARFKEAYRQADRTADEAPMTIDPSIKEAAS